MAPLGAMRQGPLDRTGGRALPRFCVNAGETASQAQHIAFTARTRPGVDACHRAAPAAGRRDHGGPDLRPEDHRHSSGALVLDPDGNTIGAVCHDAP